MSFHKDLPLTNSELLKDVVCPICKEKETLRFYHYSDILALHKKTVCDKCGVSFDELQINTKDNRVIIAKVGGYWKYLITYIASACGDCRCESNLHFEPLAKSPSHIFLE